MDKELKLMK